MIDVKFDGLDEVLERAESLAEVQGIEAALTKACMLVEASAKQYAPKDTGALRRSITSKIEQGDGEIVGVVFTPLEYAPYVEYGTGLFAEEQGRKTPWSYQDDEGNWHDTKGMKPHPYMRPALEDNRDKIIKLIKEGLGK